MLMAVVGIGLSVNAQLSGQFITGQDGHIYFQALNTMGYAFPVSITASSYDRSNSETITVGQGFVLGPSTPWKWYWKSGDRITVTYPNGQSVYWQCSVPIMVTVLILPPFEARTPMDTSTKGQ